MQRQGDEPQYPMGVLVWLCTVCHELFEDQRSNCSVCGAPTRMTQVFNSTRGGLGR